MLHDVNLEEAVAEGILTADQAVALQTRARRRAQEIPLVSGQDERFLFLRSFNDLFLAIGVGLLGSALIFFSFGSSLASIAAAAITWALAELLVGRMRLVLPGILLACLFAGFVARVAAGEFPYAVLSTSTNAPSVCSIAAAIAATFFYVRFRLPFALLLIAGGLVCALVAAAYFYWDTADRILPFILLSCGLIVFTAAMAFDVSDRERLTRRADCAFWLHLLAAPLIVHSLIRLVSSRSLAGLLTSMTPESAALTAAIFGTLTLVAIVVDRRALLVSALTYFGVVIGYTLKGTIGWRDVDSSLVLFATLGVLGGLVIGIGVVWRPVRRIIMDMLPPTLVRRLPPIMTAPSRV